MQTRIARPANGLRLRPQLSAQRDWLKLDSRQFVDGCKDMDSDNYSRIESAVAACLNECRNTDRPYVRVSAFLDQLRADGWADHNIIELQTRVIRKLIELQRRDE